MLSNKEIGDRIRQQRKVRSMTIQELADAVGVQNSTISRYENGSFEKIKLPIIEAIGVALRINPAWLVGKSESPYTFNSDKLFPIDPEYLKDEMEFKNYRDRCSTDLYYTPTSRIKLDHDFSIMDSDGRSEQFSLDKSSPESVNKMWALLRAALSVSSEHLDMARIMLESIPKK